MTKGSTYGNTLHPGGFRHLNRFSAANSPLAQFLYPFTWRDVTFMFDDFNGGENMEASVADYDEGMWISSTTSGTALVIGTNSKGGAIIGTTGTSNGEEIAFRGDACWLGDQNCGLEIRWQVDDNTKQHTEMGLTDPLSGYGASVIDNIDTPTLASVGQTDVALVGFDTSNGSTLTQRFITDGSTSDMNVTGTDLGTRTPTGGEYQSVRIQLARTASAVAASTAYIFDDVGVLQEQAQHGSVLASQIKGSVLMQPWFYCEPVDSAARVVTIDYIALWQDRA